MRWWLGLGSSETLHRGGPRRQNIAQRGASQAKHCTEGGLAGKTLHRGGHRRQNIAQRGASQAASCRVSLLQVICAEIDR